MYISYHRQPTPRYETAWVLSNLREIAVGFSSFSCLFLQCGFGCGHHPESDSSRHGIREIARLESRRRELAAVNSKDPQLRLLWKALKPLQTRQLEATVRQIARDWQAARIDFYDSRGALWPWCVALGGEKFYRHVIQEAEIYEERA